MRLPAADMGAANARTASHFLRLHTAAARSIVKPPGVASGMLTVWPSPPYGTKMTSPGRRKKFSWYPLPKLTILFKMPSERLPSIALR